MGQFAPLMDQGDTGNAGGTDVGATGRLLLLAAVLAVVATLIPLPSSPDTISGAVGTNARDRAIKSIKAMIESGREHNGRGEYRLALDDLSRAEEDLRDSTIPEDWAGPLRASILGNQAIAHYHRGEYLLVLQRTDAARALFEQYGDSAGLLTTEILAANTLMNLGRMKDALSAFHQAAGLAEEMKDGKRQADALSGLALAYQYEGRQDEAMEALLEAGRLHEVSGDKAGAARDLNNIGLVFENRKDYGKARTKYEDALQGFLSMGMPCEEARVLSNLGHLAILGNDPSEARRALLDALELQKPCGQPRATATLYEYLGHLSLSEGRHKQAADWFDKSRALAEEMGRPEAMWRAFAGLGDAWSALGNKQDALVNYSRAVETIERLRRDMIEPQFREDYLYDKIEVYNRLIRLLLESTSKYGALEGLDRRNRWWSAALLRGPLHFQDRRRQDLYDREGALFETVRTRERDLSHAKGSPAIGSEASAHLLAEKTKSEEAYRRFLQGVRKEDPVLYSRFASEKLDVEGLVRRMPHDTAVIAYFLDGPDLFAFSLTSEGLKMRRTSGCRDTLVEKTAAMREAISSPPGGGEGTRPSYFDAAASLHAALIEPLDREVHRRKRWYILPDGILWTVPFGALGRPTAGGFRHLVDDHVTTIVNTLDAFPSVETHGEVRGRRCQGRVVAFGDPGGTLPAAAKEAQLARTLHPEARVLSGAAATEANARLYAPEADILMFASHAIRPLAGQDAWISLAAADGDDGRLTANEIRGLDLKGVDVVVLSACGTGLDQDPGQGLLSLADAFLFAGAASVVATLWDVSDEGTFAFMQRFIPLFRENESHEESLRLAQVSCLTDPIADTPYMVSSLTRGARYVPSGAEPTGGTRMIDLSHPYYWAPFIVIKFGLNAP